MARVKVAVLLDPANDWIEGFARKLPELDELAERFEFSFHKAPAEASGFDIVFILGYTKLLGADFLHGNRLNLVVHESALPEGKGFSPVQWQVLQGKAEIPVCLFEAVAAADAGDIFGRGVIRLDGYELLAEIRQKQGDTTIELIRQFLGDYPHNRREPQQGNESFFRRRTAADDEIDPDRTIRELFNHFRIADNEKHPLYFRLNGHSYTLKIALKE